MDQSVANLEDYNEINQVDVKESLQNLIPTLLDYNQLTFDQLKKFNIFSLNPIDNCLASDVEAILATISHGLISQTSSIDYEDEVTYEVENLESQQELETMTELSYNTISEEDTHEFEARVREYFPDVWIYDDFIASNMKTFKKYVVPDTMTSWRISGISIHPEYGIAIAAPKILTVTKDYFLIVTAPEIARVGEVIAVKLSVHGEKDFTNAEVRIEPNKMDYEFVVEDPTRNSIEITFRSIPFQPLFNMKNSYDEARILLRLLKPGKISIRFSLTVNNSLQDKIKVNVKVKHAGIVLENNIQKLIDLRSARTQNEIANISLPPNSNLLKAELMLSGNLLGPAMDNLSEMLVEFNLCLFQVQANF